MTDLDIMKLKSGNRYEETSCYSVKCVLKKGNRNIFALLTWSMWRGIHSIFNLAFTVVLFTPPKVNSFFLSVERSENGVSTCKTIFR